MKTFNLSDYFDTYNKDDLQIEKEKQRTIAVTAALELLKAEALSLKSFNYADGNVVLNYADMIEEALKVKKVEE